MRQGRGLVASRRTHGRSYGVGKRSVGIRSWPVQNGSLSGGLDGSGRFGGAKMEERVCVVNFDRNALAGVARVDWGLCRPDRVRMGGGPVTGRLAHR